MRHKKAQALALAKIVTAAIVLLVLIVVAVVGVGMIKKGFNNLLRAVGLAPTEEGAAAGDYILQASAELEDEDYVILHFTPNPTRCAEIRENNPYKISQGFAPYGENYIPDSDYQEIVVLEAKGDCGKERLYPAGEDEEPIALVQPDEYGTHLLRIDVYGDEQEGFPLESVPVEVNEWERLLMTYLNRQMSGMGDNIHGRSALRWSLIMHTDPGSLEGGETSHPGDQSMNLGSGPISEIEDLLGLSGGSIEDLEDLEGGTFQDFLVKMGCAYPEDHAGILSTDILQDPQVKGRTLRTVVTALFGDIQDFNWQSGQTHHVNQPVPRLRNGVGIRGYASKVDSAYRDQLLPSNLYVKYPGTSFDTDGFTLMGVIMSHGAFTEGSTELGATSTFNSPENSCFRGDPITVELKYCPKSTCQTGVGPNHATEIDECNEYSEYYQNCCPEAAGVLPAVTPKDSYYLYQGRCYHCESSGLWGDSAVDASLCAS